MINQKLSTLYKKKIISLINEIDPKKINELTKLILQKKKQKKKDIHFW